MSTATVTVCRGCCCGRPDTAAARDRLARLRHLLGERTVRTSRCLGPCDHRDVVVVSPAPAARAAGARPVWLGWTARGDAIDDLAAWVADGGPGLATVPAVLTLHTFEPTGDRRPRSAAG